MILDENKDSGCGQKIVVVDENGDGDGNCGRRQWLWIKTKMMVDGETTMDQILDSGRRKTPAIP